MKMTDALLCDFATVREGLLHILGGGITVVSRDTYPSPLNLTLALLIEMEREDFSDKKTITVDLADDQSAERVGGAEVGWDVDDAPSKRHPDVPYTIPFVLPLPIILPRPSLYTIKLATNGEMARILKFEALEAEPMVNVTPRSMII